MIFLVDDVPEERQLVAAALRRSGMEERIVEADDGVKALETLAALTAEPPRLLLLDLKLPRLDGFEVLRRVRSSKASRLLPVVILSGSDHPADVERAYALGANGYMCKPSDFSTMVDHIGAAARYWLKVNVPPPARPPADLP